MKLMKTLLATAIVASSVPAMAATYQAGDIMVKAGIITVQPTNNATDISASANITVGDDTQIGITGTYMFHSNWGVEVLAATPFTHKVNGSIEVDHLPPTASVQYYPLGDEASTVQPYIGMGINYTTFLDTKGIDGLKDSWGLSYSAGVNVHITDSVMANVAVWKIDIDTEIEGNTLGGTPVTIDPTVFLVGVGYKF